MPDDGRRYELIDGEIVVSPSPSLAHQELVLLLVVLLDRFVRAGKLGRVILAPFDVHLGPNTLQPGILYVSTARFGILRVNHVQGGPDLVVEVASPSTQARDEGVKHRLYAAAGVLEYWRADPIARTFRLLVLDGGAYRELPQVGPVVSSVVLPGLDIDLAALFADLP